MPTYTKIFETQLQNNPRGIRLDSPVYSVEIIFETEPNGMTTQEIESLIESDYALGDGGVIKPIFETYKDAFSIAKRLMMDLEFGRSLDQYQWKEPRYNPETDAMDDYNIDPSNSRWIKGKYGVDLKSITVTIGDDVAIFTETDEHAELERYGIKEVGS